MFPLSVPLEVIANVMLFAVKYEARLEDGTVISKSDGVEFTVKEGGYQSAYLFVTGYSLCFLAGSVCFLTEYILFYSVQGTSVQL